MKLVPVMAAFAILLAGTASAEAKQVTHHSRHHHRAHIRHSHFAGKANLRPRPAPRTIPEPVAVVDYGHPRAITALPLPPADAPEFGVLNSPTARTSVITAVAGKQETPASLAVERSELTEVAMLKPPTPSTAPLATPAPAAIPSPETLPQPAVQPRFNHPTPIALPESQPSESSSTSERAPIVAEHEDDDQPLVTMTGGYVALPRVAKTRPFPELVPMRGYDFAASATTVFSRALATTNSQSTDPAVGFFLSFHRHTDIRWLDIEAHYGLNQTSTSYAAVGSQPAINLSRISQELSADLLIRRHLNRAKPYQALPYLGIGGGMLYFHQASNAGSSFLPAGLLDTGLDIPTNSQHVSLRVGSHVLVYPTPNFGNSAVSGWSVSTQPSAGVLFHF